MCQQRDLFSPHPRVGGWVEEGAGSCVSTVMLELAHAAAEAAHAPSHFWAGQSSAKRCSQLCCEQAPLEHHLPDPAVPAELLGFCMFIYFLRPMGKADTM